MSITLSIIIITVLVSFMSFSNSRIEDDLIFYPTAITYRKQWYRFITCGLIHADPIHLIFNMYALYSFGTLLESRFIEIFGFTGKLVYVLLYITSLIICLLPTYSAHKENSGYRALGASGAISAVSFCYMLLYPVSRIGIIFIPGIRIPAFLFGPLYLIISSYLAKRGGGRINHSAHYWGAVYGVAFLIVIGYVLSDYPVLGSFIDQVSYYFKGY